MGGGEAARQPTNAVSASLARLPNRISPAHRLQKHHQSRHKRHTTPGKPAAPGLAREWKPGWPGAPCRGRKQSRAVPRSQAALRPSSLPTRLAAWPHAQPAAARPVFQGQGTAPHRWQAAQPSHAVGQLTSRAWCAGRLAAPPGSRSPQCLPAARPRGRRTCRRQGKGVLTAASLAVPAAGWAASSTTEQAHTPLLGRGHGGGAPLQGEVERGVLPLAEVAAPQPDPAQVSRHRRLLGSRAARQAARLRLGAACSAVVVTGRGRAGW